VVVRINRQGELRNSRPCNQCIETMTKYNIKRVIYSTDDGLLSERPGFMQQCHTSSGWNAFYNKFSLNKQVV
jgi:hypothetical protein